MVQVSQITVKDSAGTDRDVATLTAIAALIGEVQASPTSNSLLDRLKAISTLITATNGYVDGLETLVGSTNTLLTTQNGYLDQLEGYVDGLETLTGAVNETAPASDTASSGQNGRLQRIAQRLTSLIALLPTALGQGTMSTSMKVVLPSDQSAIPVTQASIVGSGSGTWVTWARPSNTTPYSDGDVIGATGTGITTLPNRGPSGSEIIITGAKLRLDITALPSGMTGMRLHLYKATPPSALADNAAWDFATADLAVYAGFIDFDTPVDLGTNLFQQVNALQTPIKLNGTSLFCYLQTLTGYTPTSGAGFGLMINAVPA